MGKMMKRNDHAGEKNDDQAGEDLQDEEEEEEDFGDALSILYSSQ